MKLKICGMKQHITSVADLQPDYMGFVFWKPSSRYFNGNIPAIHPSIKKVGVFVDAPVSEVLKMVIHHHLQAVQLHGKESPEYCRHLKEKFLQTENFESLTNLEIIKVFSIKNDFDFSVLQSYEPYCDYFLFDTKGDLPGGNGYSFDWKILEQYPSKKPYFLSGGIGYDDLGAIVEFKKSTAAKNCHAIDVNSKFELEPGWKDVEQLKKFIKALNPGKS